jgi:L-asparaginase
VLIVGTGGTIHSFGAHSLDLYNYGGTGQKLEIEDLVERFAEVHQFADVIPLTQRKGGSPSITPSDWLDLVRFIHRSVEELAPVTGIVVTHGTASLEETAYFLNLTLKVDVPVILTASQRPPSALSSDAGLNFVNAVRAAVSPDARGLGVVVLLNDEIQAAREVTKGSTYRLETFQSRDLGMLGYADADAVVIYRRPARRHAPDTEFEVEGLTALPRVGVAYCHVGADGIPIDAMVDAGVRGVVMAGFAPGGFTPDQERAVKRARERGVLVVLSCRAGSGRVLDSNHMRELDVVAADNLNPQKAAILASLALTVSSEPDDFRRMCREY